MKTPIDDYLDGYDISYAGEQRDTVGRDIAFNRKSFGKDQPENPEQGMIWVGTDGIRVELVQDFNEDDLKRLFSYAINASRGVDPENPPDATDWEELMKGGLQTSLEDIRIAFAVYRVSRTMTHQTVRSRRAAFHQQSQRAHYYGDWPSVRMPESFLGKSIETFRWTSEYRDLVDLKDAYMDLAEHAAEFYRLATDAGVSYQDARFALLEGTCNFILCEYSLREFIDVYAYRACSMFQWEIVAAMRLMKEALVEKHPWLDKYVLITCEKTHGALDSPKMLDDQELGDAVDWMHTCMFQGWETVEDQCDFPWARESNRQFRSDAHRIENKS